MPRYFIEVAYKGTKYSGFQVQQNGITIQSEIEKALAIKFKEVFYLTGSSRTDAGVHALQNYFHFDTVKDLFQPDRNSTRINTDHFLYSINSILPEDIVVKNFFEVGLNQHCRFDAVSREYRYQVYSKKNPFYKDVAYYFPYKVDFDKLQNAAAIILATKNFTSFSKKNTQVNNFVCSIYKSEWILENELLVYTVIGNRFLRGMVKGLVGTMLKLATNKISLDEFNSIVLNDNNNYTNFSVPAHALFLVEVRYTTL